VLVGGKLQGVGTPGETVSFNVHAMEIMFEIQQAAALPRKIAAAASKAGARYRVEVPEKELYAALEELRRAEARILSVAAVRPSLEDYFFRLVDREKAQSQPMEAISQ
jgi:hypothetical protein